MSNEEYKKTVDVSGEILGIVFRKRDKEDNHVVLDMYLEDDEYWYKNTSISSHWIDDMIEVLQETKLKLDSDFEKTEYGYQFK